MIFPAIPKRIESALKALCSLSEAREALRSNQVAQHIGVPPAETAKVLQLLSWGGFVNSRRGAKGGFWLARPPEQIRASQVISFLDTNRNSPAAANDKCGEALRALSAQCQRKLQCLTVADLASGRFACASKDSARKAGSKVKKSLSLVLGIVLLMAAAAYAQAPTYTKPESGTPILTGFVGTAADFQPGQQQVLPTISPIVLIPFGKRWLIESEAEFEGTYTHQTGQPWDHEWGKGVEYAQIDFIANKYLTVVGGRFLTPFGIFNERLHPGWIRNFPTAPMITDLEMTDSNGGMVRGAIPVGTALNVNYAAFFSASTNNSWVGATRAAGGRVGFFFARARLEIGTSFQRKLQDDHVNSYGVDFIWQSTKVPLDIRGEIARNRFTGSGYWIEGAYRMRRVPFWRPFMRKSQAELRFEQYFTPTDMPTSGVGADMGNLPDVNTQRFFAGWSYWVRPDIRANVSYGRQFNSEGDHNIWTVGLTYRFAFPLSGGSK